MLNSNFIIKGFWTIVFIFIIISTNFLPICPPAFFKCLSNSGTYMELWTMFFIESMLCVLLDSFEWILGIYKLNVLTWLGLLLLCMIFYLCSYSYFLKSNLKGCSLKFRVVSWVRQTPEEGRRTYWSKRFWNNNKDEDNSPKTLNDKNHQALSQKFRQLK